MNWHNLNAQDVLKKFKVNQDIGLNNISVAQKQANFGKNILKEKKSKGILAKFFEQFSDFMVIILLIAAAISFITSAVKGSKDYIDSIIILFIVVMNAIVGVVQENKAEKAIDALKKLSSPKANVIRGGKKVIVLSEELVPGDILLLHTGDLVPADARLLESYNLKAEESSLTGESLPVEKDANKIFSVNSNLGERRNMVFSTSTITAGHAKAIVVETGMNTQVGKIAGMIINENSFQTPLQLKLEKTSKILGICAIAICAVIFVLGVVEKIPPLEMFMIAISLAVAAIPEGLPAVVTIVLAMGVRKMAANRAVIRKLPAVETLGNATVICSDKTGTLTQNKMTVTQICDEDGKINFSSELGQKILTLGALCNNASVSYAKKEFHAIGEPTESALVLAAAENSKVKAELDKKFPKKHEIPFDSERKLMTTVHQLDNGKLRIITKGAPDFLLERSSFCNGKPLSDNLKRKIKIQNENMAKSALRVLAIAYKDVDNIPNSQNEIENKLNFCGLIGMIDPPRPQVKMAVNECKNAGIKPVMITGDHIATAKAIANNLGILSGGDKAISGTQLEKMSQADLEKNIFDYSVFARVSPEHKVRIVKAFKKHGETVAMTGDGVNDAPALKAADIGCAMGVSGTDVAKNAADMIMTDDNFSTIVEAVRQGRGIFENIKKSVHFLISTNIGEIITVLTAFLLNLPSPLLAIQLLWINLVTDSFPALALGVEPVDENIMTHKPQGKNAALFSKNSWRRIVVEGCFIGAISILAFTIGRVFFDVSKTPIVGRTMSFAVLSLSQLVHSFNIKSEKSLFKINIFSNMKLIYSFILGTILQVAVISVPSLSVIFKTANLNLSQWLIVSLLSLSPLLIVELEKFLSRT